MRGKRARTNLYFQHDSLKTKPCAKKFSSALTIYFFSTNHLFDYTIRYAIFCILCSIEIVYRIQARRIDVRIVNSLLLCALECNVAII